MRADPIVGIYTEAARALADAEQRRARGGDVAFCRPQELTREIIARFPTILAALAQR